MVNTVKDVFESKEKMKGLLVILITNHFDVLKSHEGLLQRFPTSIEFQPLSSEAQKQIIVREFGAFFDGRTPTDLLAGGLYKALAIAMHANAVQAAAASGATSA